MFLLFVIFLLPDLWKEVNHKSDDQLNIYLYFQQVIPDLTVYYLIIKKTKDKIVTKQLPESSELKEIKALTIFSNSIHRTATSNA